jgi:hypothetical protein
MAALRADYPLRNDCEAIDRGRAVIKRGFWIAWGIVAHLVFLGTVVAIFRFLSGPESPGGSTSLWAALVDVFGASVFFVSHSLLLHPATRKLLSGWIPSPAYGVFFCMVTCVAQLLMIYNWQPLAGAVWELHGPARIAMRGAYCGAWIMLLYSLYLAGVGYQTGWTAWWPWIRGREVPNRPFAPRSLFLWLRHPVYLSFLGLIWLTPCMTYDRALLTALWTPYVFIGSWLKDRRLEYYIGEPYRAYEARVPGYPGMFFGGMGRIRLRQPVSPESGPALSGGA